MSDGKEEALHIDAEGPRQDKDDGLDLKAVQEQGVVLTDEMNKTVLRKIDKHILIILTVAYFWQIFDKAVWGYGNVFGLSTDTHLHGRQYSLASSINAIAQLCWLPFSSYLIVRVPSRYLMTILILGWGTAQACLPAAKNFGGLMACRFFLGLFEAACLPLYSVLTTQWYRRSEQPIRVACWYSTNGTATIIAALLSYGLGRVNSDKIQEWQLIYLVAGLLTVITAPFVYMFLDSDIPSARFLTSQEKEWALERLRANQTGTGSYEFKWRQLREVFLDVKTYIWLSISVLLNVGASVTGAFGPTLIKNFGFDKYVTALLNMPFGFVQFLTIITSCYLTYRWRLRSPVLLGFLVPVLIGLIMLYVEESSRHPKQSIALAGYYLLGFLFGGNTILVTWMMANTGGQTKKTVMMVIYNIGSSIGNIVGPLLFNASDAPYFIPGVRSVLAIFCVCIAMVILQIFVLYLSNKARQRQRVANGKPQFIKDTSMSRKWEQYGVAEGADIGRHLLEDLTDVENDEFIYVY